MQLVSFLKQQPLTLDSTCSFKVQDMSLQLHMELRHTGLWWHSSGESDSRVLHLCPIGWWSLVLNPLDRDVIKTHILPRVEGVEEDDLAVRRWTERRREKLKSTIKSKILNWKMRIKLLERLERVSSGYWINELFTELEQEPVTLSSICSIKHSVFGYETPWKHPLISKLQESRLKRYSTGPRHSPVLHFMPLDWWALVLDPLDRDVIEAHILPRIRCPIMFKF